MSKGKRLRARRQLEADHARKSRHAALQRAAADGENAAVR